MLAHVHLKLPFVLTRDCLSEVWLESLIGVIWLLGERLVVLWASESGGHVGASKVELRSGSRLEAWQVLFREDEGVLDSFIGDIQVVLLGNGLMLGNVRSKEHLKAHLD